MCLSSGQLRMEGRAYLLAYVLSSGDPASNCKMIARSWKLSAEAIHGRTLADAAAADDTKRSANAKACPDRTVEIGACNANSRKLSIRAENIPLACDGRETSRGNCIGGNLGSAALLFLRKSQ